ncbi:MAG: T9SS type A sorting domain-containing protein, partial [Bacteroidota bacterium]
YFLSGADEEQDGNQSNYVVSDMAEVSNAMLTAGFTNQEIQFQTFADGAHSEWFWAREFPDVYQWLFAGAVSTTVESAPSKLEIFPNPAGAWVRVSGVEDTETIRFRIYNSAGALVRDTVLAGSSPLYTGDLPSGLYVVKARKKGGKWLTGRLVR